jgi:hypothetical protein
MEKLYHYMSISIFIQGKQGLSPRSGQEPYLGETRHELGSYTKEVGVGKSVVLLCLLHVIV